MNFDVAEKYGKAYFMPPEVTYDWVKKDAIEKPPIWCSVDLRDGNQALIEPMSLEEKIEFFQMLVDIGFKEIEVGFPAASETEYNFMRALIERNMIPEDVTVQVLTQAREHIIKKTFEAVKGAPHAVIHLYNSTSVAQREQVFKKSKEEILKELEWLKGRYHKAVVQGRNRTCFSLVLETEPFYVAAVRDAYGRDLDEIITDVPEIREMILGYLEEISPELKEKLRFYQDKLLPLYKLYRVETALDAIQKEKVWLNSGGFLVIQQTEAFVSIDVNSGKYIGKKKMEETFRKINLEAAAEIGRQLRLRNLSGIILIDFINMENPDHRDELFHVLQKLLRKDPVKSRAIDITPLHILEMTRKKVRRPVIEDIRELTKK